MASMTCFYSMKDNVWMLSNENTALQENFDFSK